MSGVDYNHTWFWLGTKGIRTKEIPKWTNTNLLTCTILTRVKSIMYIGGVYFQRNPRP